MRASNGLRTAEAGQRSTTALLFGGILSRLFEKRDRTAMQALDNPLERLEHELGELAKKADERQQENESGVGIGAAEFSAKPARGLDPRLLLLQRRTEAREAMEADIARLHEQLGTGISRSLMERLRLLLAAHAPGAVEPPRSSIEERIDRSVSGHLFARASEAAWRRVEDLMQKTGLAWPVQDGLPRILSPEDLARIREGHREEIRSTFLVATPEQQADLIQGEVKVWVYGYPAKDSYLWLQTALRGTAAALLAEHFAAAVELWMWRSPELERRMLETIDRALEGPRRLSGNGIRSLTEAIEVTMRVDEICRRVVPALVWDYVAPKLHWPDAGTALPVSVLAEGLSEIDPVCGMSLDGDRVMDRFEHAGQVHFFCGENCRRRFEATPAQFAGGDRLTCGVERREL